MSTGRELSRAIAEILENGDLNELSSKKVRRQLETKFGVDLTDRKKEIDKMLMEQIEEKQNEAEANHEQEQKQSDKNEEHMEEGETVNNVTIDIKEAGMVDSSSSDEDDKLNDEEMARRLQQEENSRGRTTRGSRSLPARKASALAKKEPTKRKKRTPNPNQKDRPSRPGYGRCVLSPQLADIVGTDRLSRKEVVKKMWEVVKERNLVDPLNKQYHICDDQLLKVFGKKRVKTFGMMKYLKTHIKDPEFLTA